MKKYVITIILCLLLLGTIGVFVVLNSREEEETTKKGTTRNAEDYHVGKKPTPTKSPDSTPTPTSAPQKTHLTMWCIATETDSNRHAYEEAIQDVLSEHPEVEFTWETTEAEYYKIKIKAAVVAKEMPDIFFSWGCAFLEDFVREGRVYCLDEAYTVYGDGLPEKYCKSSTYGGKKYGVPLTFSAALLYANMDILNQVGYSSIPETYMDLMECCQKLKMAGIIPFGCSTSEIWCVSEYLESIMIKTMGTAEMDALFRGESTWNNINLIYSVNEFRYFVKAGYIAYPGEKDASASGSYQYTSNDTVKAAFAAGDIAFYINGSWNCADFSLYDINIGIGELPSFNDSAAKEGTFIGGPCEVLSVSADSENRELAAQIAFELGKQISHYGYLDGCGLPAWDVTYDDLWINPITKAAKEYVDSCSDMIVYGDTALNGDDVGYYLSMISDVVNRDIDGTEFAEKMKEYVR